MEHRYLTDQTEQFADWLRGLKDKKARALMEKLREEQQHDC